MRRHQVSIENSSEVQALADRLTPVDVNALSFDDQLTLVLDAIDVAEDEPPSSDNRTSGDTDVGGPPQVTRQL